MAASFVPRISSSKTDRVREKGKKNERERKKEEMRRERDRKCEREMRKRRGDKEDGRGIGTVKE